MSVVRAFIAIDLSPDIRRELDRVTSGMKQGLKDMPVRWVAAKNTHLTLKFLGDVSVANLDILRKILQRDASGYTPFEIRVEELGAFPTLRRPRVIWVKVQGPQELNALQHNLNVETARMGYASEDRDFSPHLTLGRVSRSASAADVRRIGDYLSKEQVGHLGTMCIEAVHLFRSELKPTGAVYTCLFTAPLGKVDE